MIHGPTNRPYFNIDNERIVFMGGLMDGHVDYISREANRVIIPEWSFDKDYFTAVAYRRVAQTHIFIPEKPWQ